VAQPTAVIGVESDSRVSARFPPALGIDNEALLCSERAREPARFRIKNEFLPLLLTPMRTDADNEEQSRDRITGLIERMLKW